MSVDCDSTLLYDRKLALFPKVLQQQLVLMLWYVDHILYSHSFYIINNNKYAFNFLKGQNAKKSDRKHILQ